MTVLEIYEGSDGAATKKLYADLSALGVRGEVAMNLFRAQKSSTRAKVYHGGIRGMGSYRSMAYQRKSWSMENLCKALVQHSEKLGIVWGWRTDPKTKFGMDDAWVLYVELPTGQVSFHSPTRFVGPDYLKEWDGIKASDMRIIAFCEQVLEKRNEPAVSIDKPRTQPRESVSSCEQKELFA